MRPWMARVALIPVLLWVVATLSFFLLRAVPGGPFDRERAPASMRNYGRTWNCFPCAARR